MVTPARTALRYSNRIERPVCFHTLPIQSGTMTPLTPPLTSASSKPGSGAPEPPLHVHLAWVHRPAQFPSPVYHLSLRLLLIQPPSSRHLGIVRLYRSLPDRDRDFFLSRAPWRSRARRWTQHLPLVGRHCALVQLGNPCPPPLCGTVQLSPRS